MPTRAHMLLARVLFLRSRLCPSREHLAASFKCRCELLLLYDFTACAALSSAVGPRAGSAPGARPTCRRRSSFSCVPAHCCAWLAPGSQPGQLPRCLAHCWRPAGCCMLAQATRNVPCLRRAIAVEAVSSVEELLEGALHRCPAWFKSAEENGSAGAAREQGQAIAAAECAAR